MGVYFIFISNTRRVYLRRRIAKTAKNEFRARPGTVCTANNNTTTTTTTTFTLFINDSRPYLIVGKISSFVSFRFGFSVKRCRIAACTTGSFVYRIHTCITTRKFRIEINSTIVVSAESMAKNKKKKWVGTLQSAFRNSRHNGYLGFDVSIRKFTRPNRVDIIRDY